MAIRPTYKRVAQWFEFVMSRARLCPYVVNVVHRGHAVPKKATSKLPNQTKLCINNLIYGGACVQGRSQTIKILDHKVILYNACCPM